MDVARPGRNTDDPAWETQQVRAAAPDSLPASSGSERWPQTLDPTDTKPVSFKYTRQAYNDFAQQPSDSNTAHGSKATSREERRLGSQTSKSSAEKFQEIQLPELSGPRQSVQQHQSKKSHYSNTQQMISNTADVYYAASMKLGKHAHHNSVSLNSSLRPGGLTVPTV